MATREDFEEEMGETYSRPKKMIEGVRKAGKKAFGEEEKSYEADFDDAVTESSIQAKLDELKQAYKKSRNEDEKLKILRAENKLKVKLAELQGK